MLGSRGRLGLVLNLVRLKKIEGHLVSPRIAARGVLSPGEIRGPVLACEQPGATGRSEFDFPTSGLAEFLPDAPLWPDGLGHLSQTRHPQAKWPRTLGADSASVLDSRVNIPPRELASWSKVASSKPGRATRASRVFVVTLSLFRRSRVCLGGGRPLYRGPPLPFAERPVTRHGPARRRRRLNRAAVQAGPPPR